MPAQNTPADRLDLASGETLRTCGLCGVERPLLPEYFYRRPGQDRFEARCQTCRRARNAEVRRLRRSGQGVRAGAERQFGVEIEFVGASMSDVARELERVGLRVRDLGRYSHTVHADAWKVVPDGSVTAGAELVSPPLRGRAGLESLRKACEALHAAGARVNAACGLHVHHDVSDLDAGTFGRLFRGWSANQQATNGLVAPSRRVSPWARPLTPYDVDLVSTLPVGDAYAVRSHLRHIDRYRTLNVASFPRYGTVEVRQHQGTTNYAKVAAWIAFGQAFIAAAKAGDVEVATDAPALVDVLVRTGRLAAAEATALRARAAHFSGRRVGAGRGR